MEKGVSLRDRLHEILEKAPSISPEVLAEILNDLDAQKKVDTDGGIGLLYTALEYFATRFADQPALRSRVEPLVARLEALEAREVDEFEAEYVARFRVKPGEISDLYAWGRDLLEK